MSSIFRFGLIYAAIYTVNGASTPYFPVWLHHRGMSGQQIGLILALPMILQIVTAPGLAVWADGFRLRRTPIVLLGLGAAAGFLALIPNWGFWGFLGLWFAAASLFMGMSPLTDVIALSRARREGFNFGLPRGMGSLAYIFTAVIVGSLIARLSPEWVLGWMIVVTLVAAAVCLVVMAPDTVLGTEPPASLGERLSGLKSLLMDRRFMLAMVSAGLIQSAHAFYYGFSALVWKGQGLPENLTGLLWGTGVVVEVGFLWFMAPWQRRMGPRNLLLLGGVGSIIRWTALAFSPPLWVLFPLQALHTFSFVATFLASIQLAERLSGPRTASSAQLINAAMQGGILCGLAMIVSGRLFDAVGARGYLAMTLMAAVGLVGALQLSKEKDLEAYP